MTITKILSFAFLIAVCSPGTAFGQSQPFDQSNLYSKALFASVAEMDKEWGHQTDAPDYRYMYVEADTEITDHLQSDSDGYHVEYLDRPAQIARYKTLKKDYALLRIHPIQSDGSHLRVTVSVYYVTVQKRRLMYALSGWSEVTLRFDCEKPGFVVLSIKLGGI